MQAREESGSRIPALASVWGTFLLLQVGRGLEPRPLYALATWARRPAAFCKLETDLRSPSCSSAGAAPSTRVPRAPLGAMRLGARVCRPAGNPGGRSLWRQRDLVLAGSKERGASGLFIRSGTRAPKPCNSCGAAGADAHSPSPSFSLSLPDFLPPRSPPSPASSRRVLLPWLPVPTPTPFRALTWKGCSGRKRAGALNSTRTLQPDP